MHYASLIAAAGTMALLLLTDLGGSPAADAQAQAIQVSDAWARRAPMAHADKSAGSMDKHGKGKMDSHATGAVYATIANTGREADALVSATSDASQTVELHEVKHEGGVMKMRPVPKIAVPAGGKVEMKPGGYHVMLLGLKHDLKPGDKVAVTLKFERGGEVRVDVPVK